MILITAAFILVSAALAVTLLIYLYFQWSFQYWKKRNVPHLKGTFPLGSAVSANKHGGENLKMMHLALKQRGVKHGGGIYAFSVPKYLVVDPQIIQQILIQDFNNFSDRGVAYEDKTDPLRDNFVFSKKEKWHSIRSKLLQSFTAAKIKSMFGTFLKFVDQLDTALDRVCEKKKPVDLKEITECFTIDVIGSSAFGIECNSFKYPNSEFKKQTTSAFDNLSMLRFLNITVIQIYPQLAKLFRLKMYRKNSIDFFKDVIKNVLAFRENNAYLPDDFLNFLISGKDCSSPSQKERMTLEEITADVYATFSAGSESSSSAIAFGLYELAMQPNIQQKLRNEIQEALEHTSELTYDVIINMKYLDQVVCEIVRKYPSISFLFRRCINEYKIPGTDVVLEKDMFIFVSLLGLHYDPEFFPQPEKFDPERFNEANRKNIRPFTYLPFGDGPRKCLGYRYAGILVKIALVSFIRKYKLTVYEAPENPVEFHTYSLTLVPKHKMLVNLEKLHI